MVGEGQELDSGDWMHGMASLVRESLLARDQEEIAMFREVAEVEADQTGCKMQVQMQFLDKFDVPCSWIRAWDKEYDEVTWLGSIFGEVG
jgi:hypothetical protein